MAEPTEPARTGLLNKLWDIQLKDGCISDEKIAKLAADLNISTVEVEGVASFYHFFHRQPTGKFTIYLNTSMTSEMAGLQRIRESFERETGAVTGSVDRTGTFGLFETPCIGLSDQEPAALINFYPFVRLNAARVREIVHQLRNGADPAQICDHPEDHIRYTPTQKGSIFFRDFHPGDTLNKLSQYNPFEVIQATKTTQLAGRGGAFYPTWMKWQSAANQPNTPKYVVCNADEGEPGTFKDRVLMNRVPETLIEGMMVCAYAIGATHGIIYLRGEYRWLEKKLQSAIDYYHRKGLLGRNAGGIEGFDFDIRIQMGAGAYVCGEETALLESLEGKRGEPRTKWFFPVEKGYLQQPTVVNNVETFCAAARIIQMGTDEYLQYGLPDSPGTKLISVSGDCRKPGIYEIEWGMTLGELLDLSEAEDPAFIQESGPSGTVMTLEERNRPFAMFGNMIQQHIRCGGALTIYNKYRDIIHILMNYARFYKHESCGICTPCRAGNFIIERKLQKLQNGLVEAEDLADLRKWGQIMRATSRCGLGKTSTNSLSIALEKFSDYFAAHVDSTQNVLNHRFDMEAATKAYEQYRPE